jgi:hypothetical protein
MMAASTSAGASQSIAEPTATAWLYHGLWRETKVSGCEELVE